MSETNYASYVTNQDTDLKSAQTGSIKEDPNQEKTKGSTRRKASNSEKDIIFEPPIWMTYLKKKKKKSRSLINLKKND